MTTIERFNRLKESWLFYYALTLVLSAVWCYDPCPCPEFLRGSAAAQEPNIPDRYIEQAFELAEKIVNNKMKCEKRLIREGKVLNRKIKSPETVHSQAFVQPEVRDKELRQRPFQEASAILIKELRLSGVEASCSLPKAHLSSPAAAKALQNCVKQEHEECDRCSRYRTVDGTCNNFEHPKWGSALSCYNRLMPAHYEDEGLFRRSVTGSDLPHPRILSLNLHCHRDIPNKGKTHLHVFFGQLLGHDITLTAASTIGGNNAINCCPISGDNHHQCAPIRIAYDDPFYSQFNVTCLNFVRSAICDYCGLGPRTQINSVTAFIDASFLYGNSEKVTNSLRDPHKPGNLRMQQTEVGYLPPQSYDPENDRCSVPQNNQICFQTGDIRGNQHPVIASLQTIFAREHNHVASELRKLNTGWEEERIFQEARKVVGAEMQAITYGEFLPATLDTEQCEFDLCTNKDTFYNSSVDPTLFTEFATAAFRFGHSRINSWLSLTSHQDENNGLHLKDAFFDTSGLYTGQIDRVMKGSATSYSQTIDLHLVPEVTNFLFKVPGTDPGLDIAAFNIQRGRDHGIPTYTEMITFCSHGRIIVRSFGDLLKRMPPQNVDALRRNYRDVRDIDLFEGILSEYLILDSVGGSVPLCIIRRQFYNLKYGDRFYFEHDGVFTKYRIYDSLPNLEKKFDGIFGSGYRLLLNCHLE